jgi:hypothetical protein
VVVGHDWDEFAEQSEKASFGTEIRSVWCDR